MMSEGLNDMEESDEEEESAMDGKLVIDEAATRETFPPALDDMSLLPAIGQEISSDKQLKVLLGGTSESEDLNKNRLQHITVDHSYALMTNKQTNAGIGQGASHLIAETVRAKVVDSKIIWTSIPHSSQPDECAVLKMVKEGNCQNPEIKNNKISASVLPPVQSFVLPPVQASVLPPLQASVLPSVQGGLKYPQVTAMSKSLLSIRNVGTHGTPMQHQVTYQPRVVTILLQNDMAQAKRQTSPAKVYQKIPVKPVSPKHHPAILSRSNKPKYWREIKVDVCYPSGKPCVKIRRGDGEKNHTPSETVTHCQMITGATEVNQKTLKTVPGCQVITHDPGMNNKTLKPVTGYQMITAQNVLSNQLNFSKSSKCTQSVTSHPSPAIQQIQCSRGPYKLVTLGSQLYRDSPKAVLDECIGNRIPGTTGQNPGARLVNIQNQNSVITFPAYGLAPNGARSSADKIDIMNDTCILNKSKDDVNCSPEVVVSNSPVCDQEKQCDSHCQSNDNSNEVHIELVLKSIDHTTATEQSESDQSSEQSVESETEGRDREIEEDESNLVSGTRSNDHQTFHPEVVSVESGINLEDSDIEKVQDESVIELSDTEEEEEGSQPDITAKNVKDIRVNVCLMDQCSLVQNHPDVVFRDGLCTSYRRRKKKFNSKKHDGVYDDDFMDQFLEYDNITSSKRAVSEDNDPDFYLDDLVECSENSVDFATCVCGKSCGGVCLLKDIADDGLPPTENRCWVCYQKFETVNVLFSHLGTHNHAELFQYSCQLCGKTFRQHHNLVRHCKSVHCEDRPRPYHCSSCGQKFVEPQHLKVHIQLVHSKERPYKCGQCGKGFAVAEHLQRHIRIHTGERPYTCKVCKKKFTSISNLYRHQRSVHDHIKKHGCMVCGVKFACSSHLHTHMRTHTGEKPFRCAICGKGFAKKSGMTRHAETHVGNRPFQCTICNRAFGNKYIMRVHMLKKHRIKIKLKG